MPIAEIAERTAFFVSPQIEAASELPGNRIGHVTYETLLYIGAVAETIGRRRIKTEERDWVVTTIYGQNYQKRVAHLSGKLDAMQRAGDQDFKQMNALVRDIARRDVQAGILASSSFLYENAKALSEWQEKLAAAPE